jgi:hypothetical protein
MNIENSKINIRGSFSSSALVRHMPSGRVPDSLVAEPKLLKIKKASKTQRPVCILIFNSFK